MTAANPKSAGGTGEAHLRFGAGDRVKLTASYVSALTGAAERARASTLALPAVGASGTVLFSPRTGHVVSLDDTRSGFTLIRRGADSSQSGPSQSLSAVIVPTWGLLEDRDPEVDAPEGEETAFPIAVTLALMGVSARKAALAMDVSNSRVSWLLHDFRYYWLTREGYRAL